MTDNTNALISPDQATAEQIQQYVATLQGEARGAIDQIWEMNPGDSEEFANALAVVDNTISALVELGNQNSAIIDGYQAVVVELTSQRDQAMQNFVALEETVEERMGEAYQAGLQHIYECDECMAEFTEYLRETEEDEGDDRDQWVILNLRENGQAEAADQIEAKVQQIKQLREATDKLVDQGEQAIFKAWHEKHQIETMILGDTDLDEDDDDA
jgi:hypothetical protein